MGFDRRFTLVLAGWVAGLFVALFAAVWAFLRPDLGAVRAVALLAALAMGAGLVRHVRRTNITLARFVESLRFGDFATRFSHAEGAGFGELGKALDGAMRDLQAQRDRGVQELRFLEALVDDMPVALLTADRAQGIRLANKAARRLFGARETLGEEELAGIGATFARRVAEGGPGSPELMLLRVGGRLERAIVRVGTLERLGLPVRAITVEPVQATLDAIEVAAQTDLVRVLTHEILNSLTPVTSLAGTAVTLLEGDEAALAEARVAIRTLARRAEGLHRFIDSYRAVARPPELRRRRFAARPFAEELARLFAAEWPRHRLVRDVAPELAITADPDLLAQALINLLRNAAQASGQAPEPLVRLSLAGDRAGSLTVEVEDNGPGIPAELRGDIFLPFFTTRSSGTGVGLNLVRQIVVSHGWHIEATSGALGGALFRILAPAE